MQEARISSKSTCALIVAAVCACAGVGLGCEDDTMGLDPADAAADSGTADSAITDSGIADSGIADSGAAADAEVIDSGAEREQCNGLRCAPGERCNAWTLQCQSNNIPYPPPGEDNGGQCATDTDCKSNGAGEPSSPMCITENGADFCTSPCTMGSDFLGTDTLVKSDCPEGSVCLRQSEFNVDRLRCVKACQGDNDCRVADGYYCRRLRPANTNGYCAPAHCMTRGCQGYACGC